MAVIEFPRRGGDSRYQVFGQGGSLFQNNRLVLFFLGVLNAILFIATIAIAVKCAKVIQQSAQVSHSAVGHVISELEDLHSNHSEMMEAADQANKELVNTRQRYAQMNLTIQQLKTANNNYQKQMAVLQAEKSSLKYNISLLDGSCGKCQTGWTLFNNSCYFFAFSPTNNKMGWYDSRENCIQRGADLVIIDNQQEQFFVSSVIKSKKSSQRWWENGFWIGLTDEETEGHWVWINNVTEVEPRYWMDGEPNNQGAQGENCGVAMPSNHNPWQTRYDGRCHAHMLYWICEMPARQDVDLL